MTKKKKHTVWIIVDKRGMAYSGCHTMRRVMIATHTNAFDQECFYEQASGYFKLTDSQKLVWRRRKRMGDRAIQAELRW